MSPIVGHTLVGGRVEGEEAITGPLPTHFHISMQPWGLRLLEDGKRKNTDKDGGGPKGGVGETEENTPQMTSLLRASRE